jgi:cytoskeleton protein RodZ
MCCTNSYWNLWTMTDMTGTGNVPEPQGAALIQKPGELIRAKREAVGMTQAQIGEALHLTVHYIKSLENDEYGKLPGLTFVKGYFRSYARLLKLDEAEFLQCYDSYVATLGLPESTQEHTMRVRRRNDQAILWAVVAGVILVIGLGAGWWFFGRQDAVAPATVVASLPRSTTVTQPPSRGVQELLSNNQPNNQPSTLVDSRAVQPLQAQATLTPPALPAAADDESAIPHNPPNSTNLMTEDGPVVLADFPETNIATADALDVTTTALDAAASPPLALQPAPDAPGAALVPAGADAIVPPESAVTAAPQQGTVISTGSNTRRIELVGAGSDQLELQFAGNSWVEVDDSARVRLYSDMMRNGDALSIKAAAPFHILLGDATGVAVLLNGQPLPIAASIRTDKTARITISAQGVSAWAVE